MPITIPNYPLPADLPFACGKTVLVLTRARLLPARYPGQDTPAALWEKQA